MKEKELRENCKCHSCGKKIGSRFPPIPIFYKITVETYGIDLAAVQRQQGLGMMIGGQLAMVMGPDEDMAKKLGSDKKIIMCSECYNTLEHPMGGFVEMAADDEAEP